MCAKTKVSMEVVGGGGGASDVMKYEENQVTAFSRYIRYMGIRRNNERWVVA